MSVALSELCASRSWHSGKLKDLAALNRLTYRKRSSIFDFLDRFECAAYSEALRFGRAIDETRTNSGIDLFVSIG
jgi:hypothetical protein